MPLSISIASRFQLHSESSHCIFKIINFANFVIISSTHTHTHTLSVPVALGVYFLQKEKEEGDVQLNSMMAVVSCPQYDWRCSTCDKCVNEVDKSRRWVDPRPCPKCKKPMETWRTRDSISPIIKPEGSAPSPRELKVHGVPLPRATGVPLKRCEQPNCLRWANNGFDSCCAACTNPSLEQPAHTVQCGQRQDALQARVMREASLPDLDPPPETQPLNEH